MRVWLIWYEPRSPGAMRAIGAVWCDERRVHWASPLLRHFEGIFDPLPFMLRFPDVQTELSHFEAALEWLDAVCFGAAEPGDVQRACEREPEWRLRCMCYEGPRRGAGLSTLLGASCGPRRPSTEQLRGAVLESIEHLVREHPGLRNMPLEPMHRTSMEVARLHVTEGRRVRVILHEEGVRSESAHVASLADEHLRAQSGQADRALLVLPQYGTDKPLRLTRRVAVAGLEFCMMARALLELVIP